MHHQWIFLGSSTDEFQQTTPLIFMSPFLETEQHGFPSMKPGPPVCQNKWATDQYVLYQGTSLLLQPSSTEAMILVCHQTDGVFLTTSKCDGASERNIASWAAMCNRRSLVRRSMLGLGSLVCYYSFSPQKPIPPPHQCVKVFLYCTVILPGRWVAAAQVICYLGSIKCPHRRRHIVAWRECITLHLI